jgi:hypothetical protein
VCAASAPLPYRLGWKLFKLAFDCVAEAFFKFVRQDFLKLFAATLLPFVEKHLDRRIALAVEACPDLPL